MSSHGILLYRRIEKRNVKTLTFLGVPIHTVRTTRDGVVKQFPLLQGLMGLFRPAK